MADGIESYIFGTKPGGAFPTYDQLQNRRKIAAAMMGQRSLPFPKTFGEGLTYLGDAIGQVGQMRQLEQMEQANAGREQQVLRGLGLDGSAAPSAAEAAPAAATRSSYAPEADTPPAAPVTVQKPVVSSDLTPDEKAAGVQGSEANALDAAGTPANITPARFANVRYNNPGAQWPNQDSSAFGSTGSGVIGGGNKIAQFPSPVQGAAANMALLERGYTGMPIGAAINKWSGGGRSTVPGYDPTTVITRDLVRDPKFAVPFVQAIARGEAPGEYPMSPEQWQQAHQMYLQGGRRDALASALQQRQGVSQPTTLPTAALPLSAPAPDGPAADLPSEITQGFSARAPASTIPSAPPVSQPIRTAPPVQVAQATPAPTKQPPSAPTPTPEMQKLNAALSVFGEGNPIRDTIKRRYDELQQNQIRTYNQQMDEYKYQREQAGTAEERAAKLTQEQSAADIATRYGGPVAYSKFVDDMSKGYDATRQLALALPTIRQTQQALKDAYTGSGAETKLDVGKALRQLGVPGNYTPEVATEVLRSRLQAIAGGLIKSTVGSTNISDADRNFVEQAYSGKITMERDSLDRLLRVAKETAVKSINQHNDRLNSVASDPVKDRPIRNNYRVQMPYPEGAVGYLKSHPETATQFDQVYGTGHANSILKGTVYGE